MLLPEPATLPSTPAATLATDLLRLRAEFRSLQDPDPSQAPTRSRDQAPADPASPVAPGGTPEGGGPKPNACYEDPSTLVMLVGFVAIFYFLILRPQQKQEKQRREMLAAIKKGDRVVTTGGLHGVVESIDAETVALRVDAVRMVFDRAAVGRVLRSEGGGDAAVATR